ncbi:MAG TPA: hypothetical protein VN764_08650 [Polyangiaceae bacterium]|nr:hypothetical protein [Polyangiaceae bacterium]
MSPASRKVPNEAGRLFRSIVVLGSSLALGCGGKTSPYSGDDDNTSTGSGGDDSSVGTGGTVGTGGAVLPGSGGVSPDGTGGTPLECPPEQWDCDENRLEQEYGAPSEEFSCAYVLPQDCACNPALPLDAADCTDGTVRTCLVGGFAEPGVPLTEIVPFACECVTYDPNYPYCASACETRGVASGAPTYATCSEDELPADVLCGCEVPILR